MNDKPHADFTPAQNEYNDYKKVGLFPFYMLQNFPFIEETFDAVNYYQMLCKIVEYLNSYLESLNTTEKNLGLMGENVANLYEAYTQLQDYVNHYFDSLDVQNEINNKLDQMVKDGTLTKLIGNYCQPLIDEQNTNINNFKKEVNSELFNQNLTISDFKEEVNSDIFNQNTTISNFDDKINRCVSGSPRGVYDNLQALKNANPDHNYIYITTDNKNWNFFDTGLNDWKAGGIYQAVELPTTYNKIIQNALSGDTNIIEDSLFDSKYGKDFNNLLPNKIYYLSIHDSVNGPKREIEGTLIAANYIKESRNGTIQLMIDKDYNIYVRYKAPLAWGNWEKIYTSSNTKIFEAHEGFLDSAEEWSQFDNDINNLKSNTLYTIIDNPDIIIKNKPDGFKNGTIISFNNNGQENWGGTIEFAMTTENNFFVRFNWAKSFTPWVELTKKEEKIKDIIPTLKLFNSFEKFGVVGDSLSSGCCVMRNASNKEETSRDFYNYSWGQFIARRNNTTCINFSSSGLSTRTWLTSPFGLEKLQKKENNCEAYIIALGENDMGPVFHVDIGNISDVHVGNENSNPDTYYGNYSKIISYIKTQVPRAKIFLMNNPLYNNEYNKAVKDLSTLYDNCYLIECYEKLNDIYNGSFLRNNTINSHYNPSGYEYISQLFEKELNNCMYENPNEFKYIELITRPEFVEF